MSDWKIIEEHQVIANRAFELITGSLTCLEAWGFYLTSEEFNAEPELRNKLGTIWICALIDHIEAETRYIPSIISDAQALKFYDIEQNALEIAKICATAKDLFQLISRDEQISLTQLRNQWVHGYLAGRHNGKVSIKFIENNRFVRETITREEHNRILYEFFQRGKLDTTLGRIMNRLIDPNLKYWTVMGHIQKTAPLIYRSLCEGNLIKIEI